MKEVNTKERQKGRRNASGAPASEKADEQTEEMLMAFELLNKYKKDRNFISKDIKA